MDRAAHNQSRCDGTEETYDSNRLNLHFGSSERICARTRLWNWSNWRGQYVEVLNIRALHAEQPHHLRDATTILIESSPVEAEAESDPLLPLKQTE